MLNKFIAIMTTPIILKGVQEIIFNKKEPLSITKILDNISPDIDEEILKLSEKKQAEPIGGELYAYIDNKTKNVIIEWNFYLKNKKENSEDLIKITSKKFIKKTYIIESDYLSLKENKKQFTIISPNKKRGEKQ